MYNPSYLTSLKFRLHFFLFTLAILGFFNPVSAQQKEQISVAEEGALPLKFPWAGGMNAIQFGEIDINLDGAKDLVAFDRHGDRIMCFINNQVFQHIDYSYKAQYAELFPELYDWAIFKDYDNDGKVDIFTYSPGWAGMMVYRNVSEGVLKFERVVYPYLKTFQENGYVNLLVTDVDYPGIADVDFDGDLDILTFWGLGSFITYHRNLSMEKYGHTDSLDYELDDYCWGNFAESEESNELYFDTCFIDQKAAISADDERHTGSTLLLLDLNKDTVLDLLIGDIDFPGIFSLENQGNKYNAAMLSADTNFPSIGERIQLYSFPAAAYIDINNDNIKDLLVSPFDPTMTKSENKNSVWLYQNSGLNNKPFFNLTQKNFLQSDMIDRGAGAYPVLYDWDGDGLLDLFIGNYGFYRYAFYDQFYNLKTVYQSKIGYYRNTGTAEQPAYQLWDNDFGGLSKLNTYGLIPAFLDIDGDDKTDLLAGDSTGNLIYARNLGNDEFELVTVAYDEINIGFFSAPQIFDLNKDGLKDLILGEQNGNLNYYRNEGTETNPDFVFVTDSLGKINVSDYNVSWFGYSVPWFFNTISGETQLLVGSEEGNIYYFTDIDGNLNGEFNESDKLDQLLDTSTVNFDRGTRTSATIADISGNGVYEMIAGNYSGGLEYFNGNAQVMPGIFESNHTSQHIQISPNPAQQKTTFSLATSDDYVLVDIYNSSGIQVMSKRKIFAQAEKFELDISTLNTGLYIVRVTTQKSVFSGQLIISP